MGGLGVQRDKGVSSVSERGALFVARGTNGVNQGFAGAILKPWGDRPRTAQQIQQPMQGAVGAIEGLKTAVFSLPPLPTSAGGVAVLMGVQGPGGYPAILSVMGQLEQGPNKRGV